MYKATSFTSIKDDQIDLMAHYKVIVENSESKDIYEFLDIPPADPQPGDLVILFDQLPLNETYVPLILNVPDKQDVIRRIFLEVKPSFEPLAPIRQEFLRLLVYGILTVIQFIGGPLMAPGFFYESRVRYGGNKFKFYGPSNRYSLVFTNMIGLIGSFLYLIVGSLVIPITDEIIIMTFFVVVVIVGIIGSIIYLLNIAYIIYTHINWKNFLLFHFRVLMMKAIAQDNLELYNQVRTHSENVRKIPTFLVTRELFFVITLFGILQLFLVFLPI